MTIQAGSVDRSHSSKANTLEFPMQIGTVDNGMAYSLKVFSNNGHQPTIKTEHAATKTYER